MNNNASSVQSIYREYQTEYCDDRFSLTRYPPRHSQKILVSLNIGNPMILIERGAGHRLDDRNAHLLMS